MNALVRRFLFQVMVLSSLALQACKHASDVAMVATIWTGILLMPILVPIVALAFLPMAVVDALKKAPPGPTAVAYAPDGGRMVVAFKEGGFQQLLRMNPDDLSLMPLTSGKCFDLGPVVSPNGQSIVFSTATKPSRSKGKLGLCMQSIDGSNLRELTNGTSYDACPRFSSDGKQIVYASSVDGKEADLFLIDATGGKPRRLTSGPDNDFYPMFLPDNDRILFARAKSLGQSLPAASSNWRLWDWYTVRADGTSLTRITHYDFYDIASPDLSADGTRVLFLTGNDLKEKCTWLLYLDGEPREERLRPRGSQYTHELISPCFSPDGGAVLFTMEEKMDKITISEVHRMNLKTGETHPVTNLDTYIREVTCSPRGDSLALLVEVGKREKPDTRTELWLVNNNGTNPRRPDFASVHPKATASKQ